MFFTRALRLAAARAERNPMIKFLGHRSVPKSIDHTPKPHPASPSGKLPESFLSERGDSALNPSRHSSFSSYRDHAQQHGPLRKSIRLEHVGVGASSGAQLGPVTAPEGVFFDVSELPARYQRLPLELTEIEAIDSGGATTFE